MYVILVGAPGIGKGLVIREVSEMLKHWKRKHAALPENLTGNAKAAAEVVLETDTKNAQEAEFQGKQKGGDIMEALLIPVAADATTYEALVQAVADSYRRINYTEPSSEGKDLIRTYGHSSLCFSLQELASLMRKRTDDTVNYMLGLYDCPTDYEYITKTKGKDRVRRGCLNLLAGTTPSFMQSTFDEKLMDEGFSSRTFYVYAQKNRKNQFWIPALSDNQHEHKKVLLDHIKKLTTLYGNVKINEETRLFLEGWWEEQETEKHKRTNKSLKMTPYYSRKNIHVMKLAMAMHFGESTEMSIPLCTFKRAIEFLSNEEKNMHLALTLEGNNEEAKVAKKILEQLALITLAAFGWYRAIQQEQLLSRVGDLIYKLPETLRKPLGTCEACTAGQFALWSIVARLVGLPDVVLCCGLVIVFSLAAIGVVELIERIRIR